MVSWADMYSLSIFAAGVSAMMMGLAYAAGRLLDNPRFTVWAKTEIFQVAASIVFVFLALFLAGLVGLDPDADFSIEAGWIATFTPGATAYLWEGGYDHPEIEPGYSVYEAADAYLKNMAYFSHRAVRASRAMLGAMDEFSKYTRIPCAPPWLMCLMGVNGVNVRPLAGAAVFVQTSNLLLYSSTTAYLTVLAQLFLLEFIRSGLVAAYLPMAIVLRSLPFMRQLGGALLAICFSLFMVYPLLLFVESAFWNPYEWVGYYEEPPHSCLKPDTTAWYYMDCFVKIEAKGGNLAYGDRFFGPRVRDADWVFMEEKKEDVNLVLYYNDDLIALNSAAFISSVFLFTFNMVAITAAASLFARLLGSEVDLGRLMQIV